MNNHKVKTKILDYLYLNNVSVPCSLISKDLNLSKHLVNTLVREMEAEGNVLLGGQLINELSALISDKGKVFKEQGDYSKTKEI